MKKLLISTEVLGLEGKLIFFLRDEGKLLIRTEKAFGSIKTNICGKDSTELRERTRK